MDRNRPQPTSELSFLLIRNEILLRRTNMARRTKGGDSIKDWRQSLDSKRRFISLTSNPSADGSRRGTDKSANSLAGVLDNDLVQKHHSAYERQANKFECHLARAERHSVRKKGPIMIWIRSLNKEDLDTILNAQKRRIIPLPRRKDPIIGRRSPATRTGVQPI